MLTVDQANVVAQDYVRALYPPVRKALITMELDFFLAGLEYFNVTVVADNEWGKIEEPDFGVIIPLSLFESDITSPERLVVHYLHVMGHKKCAQLWQRVRTPKDEFSRQEVDFLEEMYNQRLFEWIAPFEYARFYEVFTKYGAQRPFAHPALRATLNTLLTKEVDREVPQYLRKIHTGLYSMGSPLGPALFGWHTQVFHVALKTTDLRELIAKYELLKTA